MSCCDHDCQPAESGARYRRILWFALGLNFGMFVVEIVATIVAGSVSFTGNGRSESKSSAFCFRFVAAPFAELDRCFICGIGCSPLASDSDAGRPTSLAALSSRNP